MKIVLGLFFVAIRLLNFETRAQELQKTHSLSSASLIEYGLANASCDDQSSRKDAPLVKQVSGFGEDLLKIYVGGAVDSAGNVYVADYANQAIRKITR